MTPAHGVRSTHLALDDDRRFRHAVDFPLTLVFNRSDQRFTEPWYFGVCRQMAYVQIFRPQDHVRIAQSPSGGGQGNPAWDFQTFIPDYKIGQLYQLKMQASYLPYKSREQVLQTARAGLSALRSESDANE